MTSLRDVVPLDGEPACAWPSVSPEWFFSTDPVDTETAKQVCAHCPVAARCLSYALAHDVTGIWAATNERQRARIRRERGIVAKPLEWSKPIRPRAECGSVSGYSAHKSKHQAPCQRCRDAYAAYCRRRRRDAS